MPIIGRWSADGPFQELLFYGKIHRDVDQRFGKIDCRGAQEIQHIFADDNSCDAYNTI